MDETAICFVVSPEAVAISSRCHFSPFAAYCQAYSNDERCPLYPFTFWAWFVPDIWPYGLLRAGKPVPMDPW